MRVGSPIFKYQDMFTPTTPSLNTGECRTYNINPLCDVGW